MTKPVLIANPRSDAQFTNFARQMAGESVEPVELQNRLRHRYPGAVVRPRVLDGERNEVWYVYRDGRWISDLAMERRRRDEQQAR